MISLRFAFKALFACLLAGLIAGSGNSQQVTGVIRGTVYDPSGATVSAAAVTVTQLETGFARTATSGAQGDFTVVELPIGHYRVQAETKGLQKFVQEGITLDVNQTATVAIHLAIGVDARQIEVQADAPLIESTSTTRQDGWDSRDSRSTAEWAALHAAWLAAAGCGCDHAGPAAGRRIIARRPGIRGEWAKARIQRFPD